MPKRNSRVAYLVNIVEVIKNESNAFNSMGLIFVLIGEL